MGFLKDLCPAKRGSIWLLHLFSPNLTAALMATCWPSGHDPLTALLRVQQENEGDCSTAAVWDVLLWWKVQSQHHTDPRIPLLPREQLASSCGSVMCFVWWSSRWNGPWLHTWFHFLEALLKRADVEKYSELLPRTLLQNRGLPKEGTDALRTKQREKLRNTSARHKSLKRNLS